MTIQRRYDNRLSGYARPPGVVNHKPGRDPRPVTLLRGWPAGAGDFTPADLDAALPQLPEPVTLKAVTAPKRTASGSSSAAWDVLDERYDLDEILATDPTDRWERVNDVHDGTGNTVPAWRRVGSSADYSIKAGSKGAVIVWSSTVAARLGINPGGGISRWQLLCAFAGQDPRQAARWAA